MAKAKTKAKKSEPAIALPDEKRVRDTAATVPVKPAKVTRAAKEAIAPAAIDRRQQIVQTDQEMSAQPRVKSTRPARKK